MIQRIDATALHAWLRPEEVRAHLGCTQVGVHYQLRFGKLSGIQWRGHGWKGKHITRIEAGSLFTVAPPPIPEHATLTLRELADWLRVHPDTIRRMVRMGQLVGEPFGPSPHSQLTFRRRAVLAFLTDHEIEGPST